ncbi:hypothetical protein ARSEF4850_001580 [Beauveria asiatica]
MSWICITQRALASSPRRTRRRRSASRPVTTVREAADPGKPEAAGSRSAERPASSSQIHAGRGGWRFGSGNE